MTNRETIEEFHKLFYDAVLDTWASTFWLGVATEKFLVTFNPGGFLRKLAGDSPEVKLLRVVDQLELARRQADEAEAANRQELATHATNLQELEQAVHNTERELERSRAMARELDAAIGALQSSQSWRFTAPLRRLKRALRG